MIVDGHAGILLQTCRLLYVLSFLRISVSFSLNRFKGDPTSAPVEFRETVEISRGGDGGLMPVGIGLSASKNFRLLGARKFA